MKSYFLAPHVYPCVTEDHVVLLDLDRDKYIGVAREQMSALAQTVKGWPLIGDGTAGPAPVVPSSWMILAAPLVAFVSHSAACMPCWIKSEPIKVT